jgi:hypothetical protein
LVGCSVGDETDAAEVEGLPGGGHEHHLPRGVVQPEIPRVPPRRRVANGAVVELPPARNDEDARGRKG